MIRISGENVVVRQKNSKRHFWIIVLFMIVLFTYSCSGPPQQRKPIQDPTPAPTATPTPVPYVSHQIKKGDTCFDIFTEEGVHPRQIGELIDDCREVFDLSALSVGRILFYNIDNSEISHLKYSPDDDHILTVKKGSDRFECDLEEFPFEIREKIYHGTIESSLWNAATDCGIDPVSLMSLAQIYDWEIDFNTEFRKGDGFSVLVEEKYLDNIYHHRGRIIAANIILSGTEHPAVYYVSPDGHEDFYDLEGRCLRKNFLKAPLQYTRISSGYTSHRRHPILKIVRPHWGIDYAAPTGTPVRAVADAVITFAGWKNGYGRYIRLKHGSTPYETGYGHLKSYAKGIKKNARVKQGQIIGYVGATGLATGPHLDYRVYYYGKPINPLKIKTEPVRRLEAEDMESFELITQQTIARFHDKTANLSNTRQESDS